MVGRSVDGEVKRSGSTAWRRIASRSPKRPSDTSTTPTLVRRGNGWAKRRRRGEANMENTTIFSNRGAVVSVRGSVIDIQFDSHLPAIYSLLHAHDGKIAIEVLAQLDSHSVRGIALTPTEGLVR